ncbi:MAG: 30S ribosomal protein S6 [Hyphomicrobium sp.]
MPLYEHTFLARQDVTQAQVEALMKEFVGVIEEGQGKVTKQEYWGVKGLAFKIKKNRKAHYALFNIDSPPAAVAEMERRMGINPDVIRFLTVRVEELETEPSVMMRKQDRDDRGERGDRGGFGGGGGRGGFGGPREGRGGPGGGGGGFRGGDREGGSTFRPRAPREGGAGFGDRPPREGAGGGFSGDRGPRPPRPPRDSNPGSES